MKNGFLKMSILSLLLFQIMACRKKDRLMTQEVISVPAETVTKIAGFYLLNEGNMNTNMASLDYYDYETGKYQKNIYGLVNPQMTMGLGDVGNDIGIYGSKMYVVVNASNKLEIMDARLGKSLKIIGIKNCRSLTFANGKAYVSAYDGTIVLGAGAPNGFIAEIDTSSLSITRTVAVGRQPEQMAVVGTKLYVANSGGYSPPEYEKTVSVIELTSFKKEKDIEVAINLHRVQADKDGDVYVTSRGDYFDTPSKLFVIDTKTGTVKKSFSIPAATITIAGDSAYVIGSEFSYETGDYTITYNLINTKTETLLPQGFITDGTEKNIQMPYGIAVDPYSKNIYITDAKDFVSSGTLSCYSADGKRKWQLTAGNIPAHLAFYYQTITK